jgi:8-oxo-dGTP diphosphatase
MSRVPIFRVRVEASPYIIRPSAYAVVRNEEAALAVVRTPRGYYLLGGGIEGDETPEHAIQREIREEAGLIVVPGLVIGEAIEIVYSAEENACFEKRSVFITAQVTGKLAKRDHDHQLIWLG